MKKTDNLKSGKKISLSNVKSKLESILSISRLEHVLGTEYMVMKISDLYPELIEPGLLFKLKLAALFHDLSKDYSRSDHEKIFNTISIPHPDRDIPGLWHAWTSAYLAERNWRISDPFILDLIRYHPTGHPDFDISGIILYISDFCEPTRTHAGVEQVRELFKIDLASACLTAWDYKNRYLLESGHPVHPRSLEFKEMLIKLKETDEEK